MKKKAVKPVTIRVYPESRSLYFIVRVWPTKKAMHQNVWWTKCDYAGLCTTHSRLRINEDGSEKLLPELGIVNLYRGAMGAGLIAHEFLHATIGWANRIGLNTAEIFKKLPSLDQGKYGNVSDDEERMCHAHGNMVSQFVERAYKLGLYH